VSCNLHIGVTGRLAGTFFQILQEEWGKCTCQTGDQSQGYIIIKQRM